MRDHFITLIQKEAEHARAGLAARIIAKVNSLIDDAIIEQLYLAREAGVRIDLIVRGMCSLRPGTPVVSENIRVVSIIDRYLEHARAFYFHNDGNPTFWLASILELQLVDSVKGWWMQADGSYVRNSQGKDAVRFQERYYENLQFEERSGSSKSIAPSSAANFTSPSTTP